MMKIQLSLLIGVLAVVLVTAKDEACEDASGSDDCVSFKEKGYCQRSPKMAYEKCASTCDICNGPPCEDQLGEERCKNAKRLCRRFTSMRTRSCRKTCGTCTGEYDV